MAKYRSKFQISEVSDVSKETLKALTGMGRLGLRVGLFGGTGVKKETKHASPAQYMYYQEYGTETVPESPWFRSSLEKNGKKYGDAMAAEAAKILDKKTTPEHALTRLGVDMVNDLKLSITEHQLIDTGTARNSVTFQVFSGFSGTKRGGPLGDGS